MKGTMWCYEALFKMVNLHWPAHSAFREYILYHVDSEESDKPCVYVKAGQVPYLPTFTFSWVTARILIYNRHT